MKKELVYLTRIREHRYVSPFSFAVLYARIGENDQAISWLQKAYQLRDVNLPCLANFEDSTFASIKNDPRVKAIVDKIRPPQ
jgi:hypothetical protein